MALAGAGIEIVFGGGRIGLMGLLADAALDAGGKVIGVIPGALRDAELAHPGLTELVITGSMHERKRVMAERSDAFAVLPGGIGTLDEMFEIVTWRQLGLHDKPVFLVDIDGYWQPLRALLDHMVGAGVRRAAGPAIAADRARRPGIARRAADRPSRAAASARSCRELLRTRRNALTGIENLRASRGPVHESCGKLCGKPCRLRSVAPTPPRFAGEMPKK